MTVNLPPNIAHEMIVTRTFACPRERLFRVWTDPAHLARWWAPHGFSTPNPVLDPFVGGRVELDMRAPDGMLLRSSGTIEEIVPPELLAFTLAVLEFDGRQRFCVMNTVTFAELDGGDTEMVLHVEVVEATPAAAFNLKNMPRGWSETLEKLELHLRTITDR
jgi:uncharacterized protein YndB with AHSA1/START domain